MLTGTLSPVSNRADWIEACELTDAETGEPVDISAAAEIVVEIRPQGGDRVLQAATLTGATIAHVETGVFQWRFAGAQMATLRAGTYDVKCRITKDEIVSQLIIGTLPVLDG